MKPRFLRHFTLAVAALGMGSYQELYPRGEEIIIAVVGTLVAVEPLINANKRQAISRDFLKKIFVGDPDAQRVFLQMAVGGLMGGFGLYKIYTREEQNGATAVRDTLVVAAEPSAAIVLFRQAPESFKDTTAPDSLAARWPDTLTTEDWDKLTISCLCPCFKMRPKVARTFITLIRDNNLSPEYLRAGEEYSFLFAKKRGQSRYLYVVNNSEAHSGRQENAYAAIAAIAQDHSPICCGGARRGERAIQSALRRLAVPAGGPSDKLQDDWTGFRGDPQAPAECAGSHSVC